MRPVPEDAHPDALTIEATVHQLRAADLALEPSEYAAELIGLVRNAEQYGEAALNGLTELVMVRARLGSPPPIPDLPRPGPLPSVHNGRPTLRQLLVPSGRSDAAAGSVIRQLPAKASRKGVYPNGAHCPLRWFPDPVRERAEYLAWWLALEWLASELGDLQSLTVTPPGAPRRPWAEREE